MGGGETSLQTTRSCVCVCVCARARVRAFSEGGGEGTSRHTTRSGGASGSELVANMHSVHASFIRVSLYTRPYTCVLMCVSLCVCPYTCANMQSVHASFPCSDASRSQATCVAIGLRCVCLRACLHVSEYVGVCARACVYVCVCMSLHVHTCTHARMNP